MDSQTDKLYKLLSDGKPHRTDSIQIIVYGANHLGVARIAARISDIKKKYGVKIHGYKDPLKPSLFWYVIQSSTSTPKTPPSVNSERTEGLKTYFDEHHEPVLFRLELISPKITIPN